MKQKEADLYESAFFFAVLLLDIKNTQNLNICNALFHEFTLQVYFKGITYYNSKR